MCTGNPLDINQYLFDTIIISHRPDINHIDIEKIIIMHKELL
ncbi:hypothetical protein D1BOALGB6SA_5224 [Olavius sp. associated proteobacterium Delta 1]|nr:hypothetical protein D1BOALGB6SA_5224 [Olavius sp. associated proteobacterium Delta 1]